MQWMYVYKKGELYVYEMKTQCNKFPPEKIYVSCRVPFEHELGKKTERIKTTFSIL